MESIYKCVITYRITGVIGYHDEEVHRIALLVPLGHQHVLRPAASAEVELVQIVAADRSLLLEIAERPLEWYSYRGLR